jgi:hypothetical protein
MDRAKIDRLRSELEGLRAGAFNLKTSRLVSFAESVGRQRTNRGKEPTYISVLPGRNPLSIPGHPTLKGFTAKSILKVLAADLDCWEDLLDAEEKKQKEKKRNANPTGIPPRAIRKNRDSNRA